ncbi:MAG: amidohydrolase/deacetylase family metallohydrolase [Candidatus Acidiferrum sp.]
MKPSLAIVLHLVAILSLLVLLPSAQAQTPQYDLLLKGGHVIDPANNIDEVMDVAVSGGKIAAVQKDIPASSAGKVVDATGLYVTPGLIDIHVHITTGGAPLNWFDPTARSHIQPYAIPANLPLTSGVTTIVDAGTAGAESFLTEKESVMDHAEIRVLAFLNIVANGMSGGLEQSVDEMDVKRCADTINKYSDLIVGVKTAHYWADKPWDPEHQPWVAVDRAIACAAATNRPVMYDFWPRPDRSYADLILKKARPGDIHTHVFAQQFPIILRDGKLNPIMLEARQRGVFFDVGHGAGSFWFRNAVPAVKQGFLPDSISTDLHIENYTILSYDNVLSKFASMGVPLADLIKRATVNPAHEIHHPELGTLSVGKDADIAVLQVDHGKFGFIDCGWARMDGDTNITARMTVRAGRIVYDPSGLSMVEWEKARKEYFTSPILGGDHPSTADDFPRH